MQYERSKQEIKKIVDSMAGKYSRYDIFRDFIVLSACTISNSVDKQQWQKREDMYLEIIAKYTKYEANKFAEMLALMILAYESRMGDFIGELYMTMEFGNKHTGQFFTPYHVSKMMAQFVQPAENNHGIITLNEPACGSGGMIVAYAETLKLADINYQEKLRVICNDIDYDVVKMCYIQLSLLGIDAVVMQGNTLGPLETSMNEYWHTPMNVMNQVREQQEKKNNVASLQFKKMKKAMDQLLALEKQPIEEKSDPQVIPGQTSIFDFL